MKVEKHSLITRLQIEIRDDKNRIYRSFNWGPYLDLFILDGRSYRSPNSMVDTPENNKTMLGSEQLEWLEQNLAEFICNLESHKQ